MTEITGRCPMGCGATLFLGAGGHVTCSWIECPNPAAADELLRLGKNAVADIPDLVHVCRAYETKILTALHHSLPAHTDACDEGWTSRACARCDVLASVKVAIGLSRPLNVDLAMR